MLLAVGSISMGSSFPLSCLGGCPYSISPTYAIGRDEMQAGYAIGILGVIVLAIWLKLGSKMAKAGSDEKHSKPKSAV